MTQLAIIIGYLVLLLALGLYSSRRSYGTSRDYMVASNSIGPVLLLLSLFGTTMTAFALVGSTGASFRDGIGIYGKLASASGIIHSLCFLVIGVKLWKLGQKYGYRTQVQFFRDRLNSNWFGLLLFPVLVGLVIPYLLIGVIASGLTINGVTQGTFADAFWTAKGGVHPHLASGVICLTVMLYVFFGGMRGTAWANAFQTLVFMVLGLVTFVVIANHLGGTESFFENLKIASQAIPREKATRVNMDPLVFSTYLFIPLSVGMFPHIFQHWLTARSAGSFKLAVVAHPVCIAVVWVPCVLVGAWATSHLIELPTIVNEKPNLVLPLLVKNVSGPILGGLLTAGILAAIMSSLDSQFLCLGTMFTQDIVVQYAGKDRFSDRQIVLLARGFIVAVVAVTYGISLVWRQMVFDLGIWCFSGFAALVPLVLAALYWRRLTVWGASASVLATAGTWGYLISQAAVTGKEGKLNPDFTLWGMMPVVGMIAASTLALVIVSLLTQPPPKVTLERFFPTPKS